MSTDLDLNAMLTAATNIFNGLWPVFAVVAVLGFGSAAFQFIRTFVEELHVLQNGRPTPLEKPKNMPPPDDPDRSEKPKNDQPDFYRVTGIGDDGELIFEDDPVVDEEEMRWMRRIW